MVQAWVFSTLVYDELSMNTITILASSQRKKQVILGTKFRNLNKPEICFSSWFFSQILLNCYRQLRYYVPKLFPHQRYTSILLNLKLLLTIIKGMSEKLTIVYNNNIENTKSEWNDFSLTSWTGTSKNACGTVSVSLLKLPKWSNPECITEQKINFLEFCWLEVVYK